MINTSRYIVTDKFTANVNDVVIAGVRGDVLHLTQTQASAVKQYVLLIPEITSNDNSGRRNKRTISK